MRSIWNAYIDKVVFENTTHIITIMIMLTLLQTKYKSNILGTHKFGEFINVHFFCFYFHKIFIEKTVGAYVQ